MCSSPYRSSLQQVLLEELEESKGEFVPDKRLKRLLLTDQGNSSSKTKKAKKSVKHKKKLTCKAVNRNRKGFKK
jgi:hypothetical protein